MLIKPKGSPLLPFRHYATFSERKKIQKFKVFFKKSLLRFLSLRYNADFRRSRLVPGEQSKRRQNGTYAIFGNFIVVKINYIRRVHIYARYNKLYLQLIV